MASAKEKKDLKDQVRKLYKLVNDKKNALEAASKGNFVTDGQFRFGNNSAYIDIKTCKHVNQLRDIAAFLMEKQSHIEKANDHLGIKDAFTWMGATVDQWLSDVKVAVTKLNIVNEKADLKSKEEALLAMDPSLLQEIKLEAIAKSLEA
jgi:hypothetical protein